MYKEHTLREIGVSELESSAEVIRKSFAGVAKDFGLTIDNCPTNSAFLKKEQLVSDFQKGIRMFGLFDENTQVGFVAVEKKDEKTYYLEKLAVLPEYRKNGFGKILVEKAILIAKNSGGTILSIGLINENEILKKWYLGLGFQETCVKVFPHLPFTVCLMEYSLTKDH